MKKFAFSIIVVCLIAICLLFIVFFGVDYLFFTLFSLTRKEIYSKKTMQRYLNQVKNEIEISRNTDGTLPDWMSLEVIHPYLGYVYNPDKKPNINKWGLEGIDPEEMRNDDTFRIAIFGGSVANQLYRFSGEKLVKSIQNLYRTPHRSIKLYNFAFPGYKQPQQMLELNYFASLGMKFDMIINIDGFNEIALNYADAKDSKLAYFYPWYWQFYSQKSFDPAQITIISDINRLKRYLQISVSVFSRPLLYDHVGPLIIWRSLYHFMYTIYMNKNSLLQKQMNLSAQGYQSTGPKQQFKDSKEFFELSADIWERGSMQMHQLSDANRIIYLHFLQPNLYFKGPHNLSKEDAEYLLHGESESKYMLYKLAVTLGYPYLIERSERLKSSGIRFVDLTDIFDTTDVPIYSDSCCHYNQFGYDHMAEVIATYINDILQ